MRPARAFAATLLALLGLGGAVVGLARARGGSALESVLVRAERAWNRDDFAGAGRQLAIAATQIAAAPAADELAYRRLATLVAASRGRTDEAEAELAVGLALARQEGDRKTEARLLLAGASGAWQRADSPLANARLAAARALAEAIGAANLLGLLDELEARVELKRGAYERAGALVAAAARHCTAAGDESCLGQLAQTEALIALDRREIAAARQAFAREREHFLAAGDGHAAALASARLAVAAMFERSDEEAYELARAAVVVAEESGSPGALAHAFQIQGRAATGLGLFDEAEQVLTAAARLRERLGDPRQWAWVTAAQAKALLARGEAESALDRLDEAIVRWRELDDRRALAWHLSDRARIEAALGRAAASTSFATALRAAEAIDLPYVPLVLADQARWLAGVGGDLAGARAAAERAVALARASGTQFFLQEALAARAAVARADGRYRAAIADLEEAIAARLSPGSPAARSEDEEAAKLERLHKLDVELATVLVESGEIEAALVARERGRSLARDTTRGALAAWRSAARRRPAFLVSYLVTPERLYAWVVRPDGGLHLARAPVGRAHLDALIDRAQPAVAGVHATGAGAHAELAAAVLAPIEPYLAGPDGGLLVVATDGPLDRLGFAALPLADGRPLIDRFRLELAPGLDAVALRGSARRTDSHVAAVFADPAAGRLHGQDLPLARLPGARREAEQLPALVAASRAELVTGAAATETRFRELAPGAAVLHFAGHAVPFDERPHASFLALAPEPGAGGDASRDGRLSAREVLSLQLGAELVVLSGCGTARGRPTAAGTLSLARSFLSAGSRKVLATLWPVGDELAEALIVRFYAERQRRGGDEAGALRAAQLALRARHPSGAEAGAPPWAAFVLLGEAGS